METIITERISDLRACADWLEANADRLPAGLRLASALEPVVASLVAKDAEAMAGAARWLGTADTRSTDYLLTLTRHFGGLGVEVWTDRVNVMDSF